MEYGHSSPLTQIEQTPVEGNTRDALESLGLPAAVVQEWARFTGPLVRTVLVARGPEGLAGAAITVARPLASYLKIGGVWASDQAGNARQTARALVASAEQLAWKSGCVVVKRELAGPASSDRASDAGYLLIPAPQIAGPIPDPGPPVPAALFKWRSRSAQTSVPYMRQTTEFTCGPAALSMALAHLGIIERPERATELDLWREATTISACDPYGLAITAMRQGLRTAVTVSTDGYLFLEGLSTEQDRELRRFIQAGFREMVGRAGIQSEVRTFALNEVREVIRGGGVAIVLVDELLVHGQRCPHWILVHDIDNDVFIAHDPWTEVSQGESWVDGYDVPLPPSSLDRMAWTGEPQCRAMVAVSR